MPFTIFADPQYLDWSDEETELISSDLEYNWLLEVVSRWIAYQT